MLLRNEAATLPLPRHLARVAVIGGHADQGVLSGGGSSQVDPIGGNAVASALAGDPPLVWGQIWDPSSPLRAIAARLPGAVVTYDPGTDPTRAAALAGQADVAVVFATQWQVEGRDSPDLGLPDGQDALIHAVAAANPHTVVVLETGSAVTMPWLGEVAAVLEAWYPGARGGEAIADLLVGDANPSGRLPLTFPRSEAQLPRATIPAAPADPASAYVVRYSEGLDVGYRWFQHTRQPTLFPFGFGLSYTRFALSQAWVEACDRPAGDHGGRCVDDEHGSEARGRAGRPETGPADAAPADAGPADARQSEGEADRLALRISVRNVGERAGTATVQVYAESPPEAGEPPRRLVAWQRVTLPPGGQRSLAIAVPLRRLAGFDTRRGGWRLTPGRYRLVAAQSAEDPGSGVPLQLAERRWRP